MITDTEISASDAGKAIGVGVRILTVTNGVTAVIARVVAKKIGGLEAASLGLSAL